MPEISGSCLCGAVSYRGDTEIKMVINCHCSDCQKATGSAYGTMLFVAEDDITVSGEPSSYSHEADSGNILTKYFCTGCGSQLMGKNTMRAGVVGLRAGTVDQKELVAPTANIFLDSAMPSTALDPDVKRFQKMPG